MVPITCFAGTMSGGRSQVAFRSATGCAFAERNTTHRLRGPRPSYPKNGNLLLYHAVFSVISAPPFSALSLQVLVIDRLGLGQAWSGVPVKSVWHRVGTTRKLRSSADEKKIWQEGCERGRPVMSTRRTPRA
jgi:hypothetical protein